MAPKREAGSRELRGHDLRHAALAVLVRAGQPVAVEEILAAIEALGCRVLGSEPRKVLADALGHEVQRGRAVRVRRGTYQANRLAKTTRWRILAQYGRTAA